MGMGRPMVLQLWVNLPKALKMTTPEYQEHKAKDIPCGKKDGVSVKVIAGEALGIKVSYLVGLCDSLITLLKLCHIE